MNTIIEQLESDAGRLAKQAIVQKVLTQQGIDGEFAQGARMAYDAMITFGVKKVVESKQSGSGLGWADFCDLARKLATRELTGDAARDAIADAMRQATQEQWNGWYRRILIKDLRCGVSEKTINDVAQQLFKQEIVPVFAVQLAHDGANYEGKIAGEKMVEVKLDGVRVITIVNPDGRVNQYSRNGKELVNFERIRQQFESIAGTLTEPWVYDGEVMSSSFQDLMRQVHRKSDVQADDSVLHLFDRLSLEEFQNGVSQDPQQTRTEALVGWYHSVRDRLPNVQVLNHELVDLDSIEGQQRFREINQQAIAGGYEGIMIKDPDAVYECRRTTAWLKSKPFIEVTLEVQDVEQGTGKNQGRLGALVCAGVDDNRRICVNVGSGFSDSLRNNIWHSRDVVIGAMVEIRADAVTQNKDGTYSLRFPRFLRFRGFVPGEKI
jgi:DNA ligase-1